MSQRSAVSDAVLAARPWWGSFVHGAFLEGEGDSYEVLEAATARPLARVANSSAEVVAAAVADPAIPPPSGLVTRNRTN